MSLHFPILINGAAIGNVVITRQHDLIPGQSSTYAVRVRVDRQPPAEVGSDTYEVTVQHLYEDGALVLIQKALAAVTRAQRRSEVPRRRPRHETLHGDTHVPGTYRGCLACRSVTQAAFRLSRPQQNTVLLLGGQTGVHSHVGKTTLVALRKHGIVDLDKLELTPAGMELFFPLQRKYLETFEEYRRFNRDQ